MGKITLPSNSIRKNCFLPNLLAQNTNWGHLSLMQWRIICYLLSQTTWEDTKFEVVPLDVPDFCRLYKILFK